jgi:hypothetical protein
MALPETIKVKLSSEAAEGISLTAVVVREMPFRELFELMLPLTGKQAQRIRDLLRAGNAGERSIAIPLGRLASRRGGDRSSAGGVSGCGA